MDLYDRNSLMIMNRFFTLLLMAVGSVAIGQSAPDFELLYESDSTRFFKATSGMLCWTEAQAFAEQLGGHLATFHDEAEYNQIYQLLSPEDAQLWIGLVQDEAGQEPSGGWRWVTGEALSFEAWAGGEPNQNAGFSEDVGAIRFSHGGWNDTEICTGEGTLGCIIELPSTAPNPNSNVPDYVPTEGLYGWYNLDGNAIDNSGNGHHGMGTDLMQCAGVLQVNSGGVWFNGTSAVVEWTNAPELSLEEEDSLSFAMWVRSDFQNSPSHLLGKRGGCAGSNDINYQVAWQDDNISNDLLVGMTVTSCEESVPGYNPSSEWTHLAFTYASGHSKMYVNGEEFLLFDCPSYPGLPNDEPLLLGRSGSCDAFEGCMDEFGIWTTELTPEQVLVMYQSTAPVAGCTDEAACNYDAAANIDNGTCASCETLATACGVGTSWDVESGTCIVANPSDSNLDGCVQLNDLLDLLSAYGDCGAEESAWQCGDPLEYQGYDYETVQIGDQCWFAENLRAENYKNGDFIPANLDNSEWTSTTSGATVFYGDDVSNLQAYGHLYNWHAVDDARSLCPNAWRIPSDGDWTVLTNFLGGSATAGAQMKTTYGWNGDDDGANSSGFSGLPGGSRASNGNFYLVGSSGYWWSATPYGSSAWYRTVSYNDDSVNRNFAYHRNGYSVRCVQDAQ